MFLCSTTVVELVLSNAGRKVVPKRQNGHDELVQRSLWTKDELLVSCDSFSGRPLWTNMELVYF